MEARHFRYVEVQAKANDDDPHPYVWFHPYLLPGELDVAIPGSPKELVENPPEHIEVARYSHGTWEVRTPLEKDTVLKDAVRINATRLMFRVSHRNGYPCHAVFDHVAGAKFESMTYDRDLAPSHDHLNFVANGNEADLEIAHGPGKPEIHHYRLVPDAQLRAA